jgi:aspartyl-tRNA(Asn)/glutamyl-tRNA(Gln) amidotransferase subunit B
VIDQVLAGHLQAVEQVRAGDSKPMGFLMGEIMKRTSGRAEPGLLKELLAARFQMSFILVLSMGGAIAGRRTGEGEVEAGDLSAAAAELSRQDGLPRNLRFEPVAVSRILSEEIAPGRCSALTPLRWQRRGDRDAHGTDTLACTASLLYWLSRSTVPVVQAAAWTLRSRRDLRRAVWPPPRPVRLYVSVDPRLLPLNVKFGGWRTASATGTCPNLHRRGRRALRPEARLTAALERAMNQSCVEDLPGMKGNTIL